ncbi:MAG: replication-associated recombination protein A [Cyanobacteria bacterium NC_groundwater_1444_Ag_S-0.65um_54_12]|nr:replication-associated recombination protein A [Cyanobacteria bacterium NC_groundwater_1444_Ag_S-0.65um_54_12]
MAAGDDQASLFDRPASGEGGVPLAFRMRPRSISEVVGQEHLLGPGKPLARLLAAKRLPNIILWGPPGTGKTTLAYVIAKTLGWRFIPFSAVTSGIPELRRVVEEARQTRRFGEGTLLFIDEIHRFNKAQQDALLPHVENGTLTLIGATTENPSFEVNPALRSRSRIFELLPLTSENLCLLLRRALADTERGAGGNAPDLPDEVLAYLSDYANGDARVALGNLESAIAAGAHTVEEVCILLQGRNLPYDRAGESHFNVISAFHKAIRGSDPDAALYWLARMLCGGEDPLFIARRLIVAAAEDVGNADPVALLLANATFQAVQQIGMPEGRIPLAQTTIYLATATKSNASCEAMEAALRDAAARPPGAVPLHLRNAPTDFMRRLGYGQDYQYPHRFPGAFAPAQSYWPSEIPPHRYYQPFGRGVESTIRRRMAAWEVRRKMTQGEGIDLN